MGKSLSRGTWTPEFANLKEVSPFEEQNLNFKLFAEESKQLEVTGDLMLKEHVFDSQAKHKIEF